MLKDKLCRLISRVSVYINDFLIFANIRRFYEKFGIMPQELNVLRCYSCEMYQVHIEKKTKKWQCKICNEKQSVQIIYFRGTGVECRAYVQSRNLQSGEETMRSRENFRTIGIEAWGLDCEANVDTDDPCYCSQKKLIAADLSRYLANGEKNDDDDCREEQNFSLSENTAKRRKFDDNGEKQTRSLPTRKNLSSRNNDRSRSQTFPRMMENFQENAGKWDKYLEDEESRSFDSGASYSSRDKNKESEEEKFGTKRKRNDSFESRDKEETSDDNDDDNDEQHSLSYRRNYFSFNEKIRNNESENDGEDEEIVTSDELKCSQVDDSSESQRSTFGRIKNNFFDDPEQDLNVELDF